MASQLNMFDLRKPDNGELSSFTDDLEKTELAFDKVDACISNTCPKRYILFDHKVGSGTMYMHPELMQRLCDFSNGDEYIHNDLANYRFIDGVESMLQRSDSVTSAAVIKHKSVMVSAFAALEEMRNSTEKSLVYESITRYQPTINTSSSQSNDTLANYSGGYSIEHEDTADLDALLDSDDESSTAYSPSDITWTNGAVNIKARYNDQQSFNKRTTEAFFIESDGEPEVNSIRHGAEPGLTLLQEEDSELQCFDMNSHT